MLTTILFYPSFALVEISLILSKILFRYDLDLVDEEFDFEKNCRMHVNWLKPVLNVRYLEKCDI